MTRIALVATVKNPGSSFESFLRYHAQQVDGMYLFFESADDPAVDQARAYPNALVTVTLGQGLPDYQGLAHYEQLAGEVSGEIQARQMLNSLLAIRRARTDGFDWIIHVDADELIYSARPLREFFSGLAPSVQTVVLANYEALAQKLEYDDYFRDIDLFKVHPQVLGRQAIDSHRDQFKRDWFFVAYTNGKSAVRVQDGIASYGVHRFMRPRQHFGPTEMHISTGDPIILHYPNCGYRNFCQKYIDLGRFPDQAFGLTRGVRFHVICRDAWANLSGEEHVAFYRRHMLYEDPAEIEVMKQRRLVAAFQPFNAR